MACGQLERRRNKSRAFAAFWAVCVSATSQAVVFGVPSSLADSAAANEWKQLSASSEPKTAKVVREIRSMKWWDACVAWGRLYRSNKDPTKEHVLLGYLSSERMLNSLDLGHVGDRSIEIGMTECGVFASRGIPDVANHTTTGVGTRTQLVYRASRTYVYTEPLSPQYSVNVVRSYQH